MHHSTIPDPSVVVSPNASIQLLRRTGERCVVTSSEAELLRVLRAQCERRFDQSRFFKQVASGPITTAALGYVWGQYGHFRLQLHRWFAACMLLAQDASQPAQRWAVMSLADHVYTDLRDDHDALFAKCLQSFGFPRGVLHVGLPSPATRRYTEQFLDECRAPTATWLDATATLAGRELSVAVRNQRLVHGYFAPRDEPAPTWIALHAELEVDHCLDALRPVIAQNAGSSTTFEPAMDRAFSRHADYLDALLEEYEIRCTEADRETAECVLGTDGCTRDRENVSSMGSTVDIKGELVNAS